MTKHQWQNSLKGWEWRGWWEDFAAGGLIMQGSEDLGWLPDKISLKGGVGNIAAGGSEDLEDLGWLPWMECGWSPDDDDPGWLPWMVRITA